MGKGSRMRQQRQQERADFHLTPAQKKLMDQLITEHLLEKDRQYWKDMDAAVMYVLYKEFHFGATRLRRFFDRFGEIHTELRKHYQMDGDSNTWLCRYELKEKTGADIEAWEREVEAKSE